MVYMGSGTGTISICYSDIDIGTRGSRTGILHVNRRGSFCVLALLRLLSQGHRAQNPFSFFNIMAANNAVADELAGVPATGMLLVGVPQREVGGRSSDAGHCFSCRSLGEDGLADRSVAEDGFGHVGER